MSLAVSPFKVASKDSVRFCSQTRPILDDGLHLVDLRRNQEAVICDLPSDVL
jgi:hypothetical protein